MFKVQSINLGNGYVYLGIKIEAFVDFFNADVISTGHKLSEGTFKAYTILYQAAMRPTIRKRGQAL